MSRTSSASLLLLMVFATTSCDAIEEAANGARPTEADLAALRASSGCSVVDGSSLNSTFHGAIAAGSCSFSARHLGGPRDTKAAYFGIRAEDEEHLVITMESSSVDSYFSIMTKEGQYKAEDDDSGGGTNAEVEVRLRPGLYLIAAAVNRPEERGAFRLKVRRLTTP